MKDYNLMSDFEINEKVASRVGVFESGGFCEEKSEDNGIVFGYCGNGNFCEFDACKNPADAWPIIVENKINLEYRYDCNGFWLASTQMPEIAFLQKNPLRAAMIVFLMMKDAEK